MIIYHYPKCTTCKKALSYLNTLGINYEERLIHLTPPSVKELKQMLGFYPGQIKKLINTSGLLYRERGLAKLLPELQESQILEMLSKEGMLVKRPFLLSSDFGLTGFKESQWDTYFN